MQRTVLSISSSAEIRRPEVSRGALLGLGRHSTFEALIPASSDRARRMSKPPLSASASAAAPSSPRGHEGQSRVRRRDKEIAIGAYRHTRRRLDWVCSPAPRADDRCDVRSTSRTISAGGVVDGPARRVAERDQPIDRRAAIGVLQDSPEISRGNWFPPSCALFGAAAYSFDRVQRGSRSWALAAIRSPSGVFTCGGLDSPLESMTGVASRRSASARIRDSIIEAVTAAPPEQYIDKNR